MKVQSKIKRGVLGLVGAALLGSALAMPTLAVGPTVTQDITAGTFTFSVASASMTSVPYSNTAGLTNGQLTVSVNDARGSSAGWDVSLASTSFLYGGVSPSGQTIPNSGFNILTATSPATAVAGQAVGSTPGVGGPYFVSAGAGPLNVTRMVLKADAEFGSGDYTQALPITLAIPALSQRGTYTATLTISATAAP